jgi:hypothetical protein
MIFHMIKGQIETIALWKHTNKAVFSLYKVSRRLEQICSHAIISIYVSHSHLYTFTDLSIGGGAAAPCPFGGVPLWHSAVLQRSWIDG